MHIYVLAFKCELVFDTFLSLCFLFVLFFLICSELLFLVIQKFGQPLLFLNLLIIKLT